MKAALGFGGLFHEGFQKVLVVTVFIETGHPLLLPRWMMCQGVNLHPNMTHRLHRNMYHLNCSK